MVQSKVYLYRRQKIWFTHSKHAEHPHKKKVIKSMKGIMRILNTFKKDAILVRIKKFYGILFSVFCLKRFVGLNLRWRWEKRGNCRLFIFAKEKVLRTVHCKIEF